MAMLFTLCAAIGGTILVCQALLTLVGLAGDGLHLDVGHDVGHGTGGADHDVGHDGGDAQAGHDADAAPSDHGDQPAEHAALGLLKVLSFRTIVAAITFFGLAGMTAHSAGAAPEVTLGAAISAGLVAMYVVYWIMQTLFSLKSDGTIRIQRAQGLPATVYLPIPAERAGSGKIQINLQNRTMEYLAVTSGDELPTGAKVVVVSIVSPNTVEVRPAAEAVEP